MDSDVVSSRRKEQHFQQLTRPWRERLYGVALRQAGACQLAEDWTQETLLRAWRNFSQLEDAIAVYAWLLKILDRVIADDTRREARRRQLAPIIAVDDAQLQTHACASPGPFEQTLQQQTHAQVTDAIHKLPEGFRQVVILRDMEGLSYRDIAGILDLPQGTIMSRLSRGRRMLAKTLIRVQGDEKTLPGAEADTEVQP